MDFWREMGEGMASAWEKDVGPLRSLGNGRVNGRDGMGDMKCGMPTSKYIRPYVPEN